jgi:hypothetical protein
MRRPGWLVLAALLTGCADGYPREDALLLDESAMSVSQLLQALQGVNRRTPQATDVHFAMDAGCVLRVDTPQAADTVPLAHLEVDILTRTLESTKAWQVLARWPDEAGAQAVVVLMQGGQWADAVQARSLVEQLRRRCSTKPLEAAAPA